MSDDDADVPVPPPPLYEKTPAFATAPDDMGDHVLRYFPVPGEI
jgi:hypothetical protein